MGDLNERRRIQLLLGNAGKQLGVCMGAYVPHRTFINVEGQDTMTIRLKDNRWAWLTLPKDFREEDVELIIRHLRFNAELGKDALRPEGPPEPHQRAKGWY